METSGIRYFNDPPGIQGAGFSISRAISRRGDFISSRSPLRGGGPLYREQKVTPLGDSGKF